MSNDTFSRWLMAVQKVGLPAVISLMLLFGVRELAFKFLDQQQDIFNRLLAVQTQQAVIMADLAKGQEQLKALLESHIRLMESRKT